MAHSIYPNATAQQKAHELADLGFSVFPCGGENNKKPLSKHGYKDAATLHSVIDTLPWEHATAVGIACGYSSIAVIDYDPGSERIPDLPPTLIQQTPRGGTHWIYRQPEAFEVTNSAKKALGHLARPHVDVRGVGGYIVWYGTVEADWDEIAPWPLGQMYEHNQQIPIDPPKVTLEGNRNNSLFEVAVAIATKHPNLSLAEVREQIREHNALHMQPQLDTAEADKCAYQGYQSDAARGARLHGAGLTATAIAQIPTSFPRFAQVKFPIMPTPMLGEWLMPGSLNVIYSRAGLGKTGVIVEILKALYEGGELVPGMGAPHPFTGRALWVNGDLPPPLAGVQLGQYLRELPIDYFDAFGVDLNQAWEHLMPKLNEYDLVIYDTRASLFKQTDILDAAETDELFDRIRQLGKAGTTQVLATHSAKPQPGQFQSMFGSSAGEWYADNIIGLARPTGKDWKDGRGGWGTLSSAGYSKGACFSISHEKAKWSTPFEDISCGWSADEMKPGKRKLRMIKSGDG